MAGFKLTKHEPFVIEGVHGSYEIPPLENLEYEDWKGIAEASQQSDFKKKLDAFREFFIRICPDLEKEGLADNQCMALGTAYMMDMGK